LPLPFAEHVFIGVSTFDHQRLEVYRRTIDFVALVEEVVSDLPRGRSYVGDQLRRAALSIALNIAEGAGEFSPTDKARIYRIARRSATECAAIFDICGRLDLVCRLLLATRHAMLREIISMLVAVIRTCEGRGKGKGKGKGKG
jgi:four helix bundle protein